MGRHRGGRRHRRAHHRGPRRAVRQEGARPRQGRGRHAPVSADARRPGLRAGAGRVACGVARRLPGRQPRPPVRPHRRGCDRRGARVVRGPHGRRLSVHRRPRAQHPAPQPDRRLAPLRARARHDGGGRSAPRRAHRRRRPAPAQGLPRRAARRQPAARRGARSRGRAGRRVRPRRRQHGGARTRAGPPRGPLHARSAAGGPAEGRRAGRVPGRARAAPRPHGLERAAGPARAARLRDPDRPAVRPRAARGPHPHRGAPRCRAGA